jgi:hypothetical protein
MTTEMTAQMTKPDNNPYGNSDKHPNYNPKDKTNENPR